jgi:hypothetical protein
MDHIGIDVHKRESQICILAPRSASVLCGAQDAGTTAAIRLVAWVSAIMSFTTHPTDGSCVLVVGEAG